MAVPTNGKIRMVVEIEGPGGAYANNIFAANYDLGSGTSETQLLDLVRDWWDNWGPTFANILNSAALITRIIVYLRDFALDEWDLIGEEAINAAGTVLGQDYAAAVSAFGVNTTESPKVRGRKYFPFVVEEMLQDPGVFTPSNLTNIVSCFNTFIDPVSTVNGDLTPGVWSEKLGDVFAYSGSALVSAVPAYQRRRKPGVGV